MRCRIDIPAGNLKEVPRDGGYYRRAGIIRARRWVGIKDLFKSSSGGRDVVQAAGISRCGDRGFIERDIFRGRKHGVIRAGGGDERSLFAIL